MKIILMSVGTRGDMEPFLAIAEILQEKGHIYEPRFEKQLPGGAKLNTRQGRFK